MPATGWKPRPDNHPAGEAKAFRLAAHLRKLHQLGQKANDGSLSAKDLADEHEVDVHMVRKLNAGKDEAVVLQALEVSQSTYERWRAQYGGMKAEEAKRLKELGIENRRLKQLVAGERTRHPDAQACCGGKLVSPFPKRAAVEGLRKQFSVSERKACEVLNQPRSTYRYDPQPRDDEEPLARQMLEVARRRPRWGCRRTAWQLRQEGWRASDVRVYRLWRCAGLKEPQKKQKRRRWGSSANGCVQRRAERPDHVWCWDFVFDRTTKAAH